MVFTLKLWIFHLTIHLLDLDPSDQDIKIGITLDWKG